MGNPSSFSFLFRLSRTILCFALLLAFFPLITHNTWAMYDPTTYNHSNPTFVNNEFTPAQKDAQRAAGQAMMEALVKAAKSGAANYTIAPGTYRVPIATYRLDSISNFTINCPNVNIWLDIAPEYPNQPDLSWINFKNCSNIKVLGGNTNFDSERLQFIQATITGWDAVAGTLDVKVMPGYEAKDFPAKTEGNMSWTFNRQGICRTRPSYTSFVNLDPNDIARKRLTVGTKYFTDGIAKLLKVGDILFTRHNLAGWSGVMSIDRSNTDFEIDGINSWYGPMWAIDCSGGKFISRNCSNYRRPGTNRLGGSQEPFIYANMHTLVWDNCTTGGPGQDDGIDVVGGYALIAAVKGPRTIVVFREPRVGETLTFYAPDTFASEGEAKVSALNLLSDTAQTTISTEAVNTFQETIGARQRVNADDKFWEVTLDKDLPIRPFAGYDSSRWAPDVTITNSYFADMNSQALFVKGHKIEITGNRIDRSNATAIHAQISRYWWEGPVPQNVNISNNTINDNPCDYGVPGGMWDWALSSIGVEIEGSLAGVGAIRGVRIEGNSLNNSARIPIMVKNVDSAIIKNNTIISPMSKYPAGAALSYVTYGIPPSGAIFIAASRDVLLSGNVLKSPTIYCPNLIQFGPYNDIKTFRGEDFDRTGVR
ncbi:hypothetical protein IAD21_01898 [Abditibacteriota bacterium]|nr:hypothetical protein IAD21_01898 [Abditibacteriota bacterium]